MANERNVVKVDPSLPLELLGPLGYGIQTGAGAVLNTLRPRPGSTIVVFGVDSVGLAAILSAKVAECATSVAVDIQQSRLDLALSLGATHAINSAEDDVPPLAPVRGEHLDLYDKSGPYIDDDAAAAERKSVRLPGKKGSIAPTPRRFHSP